MRFWRQTMHCLGVLLLMCAVLLNLSGGALAAERTGCLVLTSTVRLEGADETPLVGDSYAVYDVADEVDGCYQTCTEFASEDCDWNLLSSSDQHKKAAALSVLVSQQDVAPVQTVTSDSNGVAVFRRLPAALYLVVQTAAERNAAYTMDVFLIFVPISTAGSWNSTVTVEPKFSWDTPKPAAPSGTVVTPPTSVSDTSNAGNVKTGDQLYQLIWPVWVMMIAGQSSFYLA